MKLRHRTYLSGFALVVAVVLASSTSAVLTINNLALSLNNRLLTLELKSYEAKVARAMSVLESNGLAEVWEYVDRAKNDLKAEFASESADQFGTLTIINFDGRQILPDNEFAAPRLTPGCVATLVSTPEGMIECPLNGQMSHIHYKKIPEWNWVLAVSATQSAMNSTRDRFIVQALIIFGIVSLAGLMLFVRLSRTVVDPVLSLSQSARAIGEGDWSSIPEPSTRTDELGELEQSFATMAGRLHEAQLELEDKAESLRLANESFESILDSMPSIVIGVDKDCRVTNWNEYALEATGIEKAQVLGKPLEEAMPRLGKLLDAIRESMATATPHRLDKQPFRQDGQVRQEDILIFPLNGSGPIGAVIRLDDVTHRVRMEEVMVQTEKMMSVGGLAAGMAHELNNPLAGVLSGTQNLLRRLNPTLPPNQNALENSCCPPDAFEKYISDRDIPRIINSINAAGRRAAEIIRSMLEFSRNSAGSRQQVDLAELIESSIELAGTEYDQSHGFDFRNIRIVKEFEEGLPPVSCIGSEIEQVVLNLLRNAGQAITQSPRPDAPPQITLRIVRDNDEAVLEVQDNGPGIPEDVRKRIFEPFFTTKPVGLGTGLGLSVSYFIITENHKGSITVDSPSEGGALFQIRLPLTPPQSESA